MPKWGKFVVFIVLIALAALVVDSLHRQLMIDECLDAGGAWDYANAICDKD
jgi:hypothetical protein